MVDPYDPSSEDKLWKNPFTSTNPLDAMLNFGNPGNSNDWRTDDSISLFTKGRDIIPPKNESSSSISESPTTTGITSKTEIADKVKQIQEKVKAINKRQQLNQVKLDTLKQYSSSITPEISKSNSKSNAGSNSGSSKSTFGNMDSHFMYIFVILVLIFIILFLLLK